MTIRPGRKPVSIDPIAKKVPPASDRAVMFEDLQIVIPVRDSKLTREVLKYAKGLVQGQDARVRLIDVVVVPPVHSLDRPADQRRVERRLRNLARQTEVRASVEVLFARNWEYGFRRVLNLGSIVLLPKRKSLWPSSEKRLAERLRRLGNTVVWVECD